MKVKCITDRMSKLTKGKEYKVLDKVLSRYNVYLYLLNTDLDYLEWIHQSHLLEVTDTTQIEVGSEWVWVEAKETTTVKYAGEEKVFYKWNTDGSEGSEDIDSFLAHFKPKPKTVTMYFHKIGENIYAYDVEQTDYRSFLFTKEIEL